MQLLDIVKIRASHAESDNIISEVSYVPEGYPSLCKLYLWAICCHATCFRTRLCAHVCGERARQSDGAFKPLGVRTGDRPDRPGSTEFAGRKVCRTDEAETLTSNRYYYRLSQSLLHLISLAYRIWYTYRLLYSLFSPVDSFTRAEIPTITRALVALVLSI